MLKFVLIFFCVILTLVQAIVISTDRQGRIVGGNEVKITQYPHQISLRYKSCNTCAYSHICGGSIYNNVAIITAAHCVYNRLAADFMIVAGSSNRRGADGIIVPVQEIIIHEKYNAAIPDYDAAILILSTAIPIDDVTTATIPLASKEPKTGSKCLITGWGSTSEGGADAETLREIEVPIVSRESCEHTYGADRITESVLCAGEGKGGKDACQRDSGGPLLVNWQLAGIVSWGQGCARPGKPGVYANVAHLRDWIETTVKTHS